MKYFNFVSILAILFITMFGIGITQEHCACPDNYLPVCASNRVTFANECEYNCAARTDSTLSILKEGPCADA